jgi:hypothetical protein
MREALEEVLELYEGMPLEGQEHWRARSLPSVQFESEAEREEFLAALRERDKQPETGRQGEGATGGQDVPTRPVSPSPPRPVASFRPGQRVKVNLSGMKAGGVSFSQNVEAAWATIQSRVSEEPPVYHVELLFSFRGVRELDVPADRIRPL